MKYLMDSLGALEKEIKNRYVVLLLDYDGTLTPIVSTPDKAILKHEMYDILKSLTGKKEFVIAIISGRSLEDLKMKVGLDELFYAGNHGMEIEYRDLKFTIQDAKSNVNLISAICKKLERRLSEIDGVLLENKGLSASVHYRLVKPDKIPFVKNIVQTVIKPYVEQNLMKSSNGKKVIELIPLDRWNKGKAVEWVLKQIEKLGTKNLFPIFLGDDQPDEYAFQYLKEKGYSILISSRKKNTSADFYLNNVDEVKTFLRWLDNISV